MTSSATSISESGLLVAPAPWTLRGRMWSFILSPLNKKANFPAGWAAPYQADALGVDEFVGGPGQIMLLQYTESPVGPYDELIYTPGQFKHKNGLVVSRITRIYVSTSVSTENGRRNWNIPKQTAKFQYTEDTSSPGTWSLSVFPITNSADDLKPFFSITVRPIPVITKWLRFKGSFSIFPSRIMTLMQPPLPKGPEPGEIASGIHILEEPETAPDGKGKYAKLRPNAVGKMFCARLVPSLDGGVGDGIVFPAVKPWSVGMCMEDLVLDFPVPEWIAF